MSRELDARVAEKVIKLPNVIPDKGIYMRYSDESEIIPHYSTDMNVALGVVRYFNGGSFAIKTHKWATACLGTVSEASVASSLPVAICLSALRAVGDNEWVDKFEKEMDYES